MAGLLQSNLLKRALVLIPPVTVQWSKWDGTTTNVAGQDVPSYLAAAPIKGSWQAVSRQMYALFGLDLQKDYRMFYTPTPLQDVSRGTATDIIDFGGRRYNVESNTNWQLMNGWQGSLCVDVGPTP